MLSLFLLFIAIIIVNCYVTTAFRQSIGFSLHRSSFLDASREVLVYDPEKGKYYVGGSKNNAQSGSNDPASRSNQQQKSNKGSGKTVARDIDTVRKSGEIFLRKSAGRRPLPWWMKDSERNHPRMLPQYKPWWLNPQNPIVNPSWTVPELRAEATRRGAHCSHWNKQQLLDWLTESSADYNLSEMNFKGPTFTNDDVTVTDKCYPEVYSQTNATSVN